MKIKNLIEVDGAAYGETDDRIAGGVVYMGIPDASHINGIFRETGYKGKELERATAEYISGSPIVIRPEQGLLLHIERKHIETQRNLGPITIVFALGSLDEWIPGTGSDEIDEGFLQGVLEEARMEVSQAVTRDYVRRTLNELN